MRSTREMDDPLRRSAATGASICAWILGAILRGNPCVSHRPASSIRTHLSLEAASGRDCLHRPATSARTMPEQENSAGRSIRFPIPAKPATRHGRKTHGPSTAERTTGRGWRSTKDAASLTFRPVLPLPTSTARTVSATTFSRIPSLH